MDFNGDKIIQCVNSGLTRVNNHTSRKQTTDIGERTCSNSVI